MLCIPQPQTLEKNNEDERWPLLARVGTRLVNVRLLFKVFITVFSLTRDEKLRLAISLLTAVRNVKLVIF